MDKFFMNIWRTMNSSDERAQRRLLLMGSVIVMLVLMILGGFKVSEVPIDTETYIAAGNNFFSGVIDVARTPVYPVICHLAGYLGAAGLHVVVLLQMAVFLLTVIIFHKTMRLMFSHSNLLPFVLTALYAWNVGTIHYTLCIMTESLSLSAVVLMFWYFVKGFKQSLTVKDAVILMCLYVVMLFLRPFFICFAPLLVLYYLLVLRKAAHSVSVVFWAGMVVTIAAYVGYCCAFKSQYGVFTTSCVPDINLSKQLYEAGLVDTTLADKDTFDLLEEHTINREVLKAKKKEWFVHMVKESSLSTRQLFPKMILSHGGNFAQPLMLQIPVGLMYMLTVAFAMITWVRWRNHKTDVRLDVIVLCTLAGIFVTSVWGAFGTYTRHMLPCYPALCIMFGRLSTFFSNLLSNQEVSD